MWTLVRQWRQKRVLVRPEAAFPYVFAAEGAQHPLIKPPRSTSRRHEKDRRDSGNHKKKDDIIRCHPFMT